MSLKQQFGDNLALTYWYQWRGARLCVSGLAPLVWTGCLDANRAGEAKVDLLVGCGA